MRSSASTASLRAIASNRLEGLQSGRRLAITARVGCDQAHWAEVYHTFELDAPYPAVYPGDDAVRGFALRVCYEQFEAFVGEAYELSVYEIGVFTPNRTNFEHEVARYRGVHCWLYHTDDLPAVGNGSGHGPMTEPTDPVLARRRRLTRWSATGRRAGYGLYGLSLAAFAVGLATGFTTAPATIAVVALLGRLGAPLAVDHHRLRSQGRRPSRPGGRLVAPSRRSAAR